MNYDDEVVFNAPSTLDERASIAQACVVRLRLDMPTLLDDMDDAVDAAYAALPDRLYIIDAQGNVAYRSEPGPWGFDAEAWGEALQRQLG